MMHRLRMRLPPCAVCAAEAPRRRGVASMASMVVDGQRSLEQVESELRQKLLISQDLDLWAAGRQGIAIALRAAASPAQAFVMRGATAEEVEMEGLMSRGEGGSGTRIEKNETRRFAFHLKFQKDMPLSMREPKKIFQVGQRSNAKFLPLAKAIATELRWLPSGDSLAAENLLLGKAKNTWTRTFALANAVAQAYEWQLNPTQQCVRPFYCVAQLRKVEDLQPPEAGRPNWSKPCCCSRYFGCAGQLAHVIHS
ncbi:unnamed protein product [Cladocopium goreaui]|uniref:Uncharacterized protein n=1 Tax=Cladocopium goreaui TaxID=2562237 RepID=A0A9P1GLC4_9DINO|nr:unnamed protein product [Cladocopium goreaui]